MALEEFRDWMVHSVSLRRQVATVVNGATTYTWTEAARGSLVTSRNCLIQPLKASEVTVAAQRGHEISHAVYFIDDPEVDERDRIIFGSREFVTKGVRDFDEQDEMWRVDAMEDTHLAT